MKQRQDFDKEYARIIDKVAFKSEDPLELFKDDTLKLIKQVFKLSY